jgi:hypothetical protein
MRSWRLTTLLLLCLSLPALRAQTIPTPEEHFGFALGADRKLADWSQLTSWYQLLATRSPRVRLDTLGKTTEGRPFIMVIVTSAANQQHLDQLHAIQLKLADPRQIQSAAELAGLIDSGKTVVLVTHSIHATEVGGAQMAARLLYRLATSNDADVREILDNDILLDIPSLNPDGLDMVVDWYRKYVGTQYEGGPLPMLYHFYVGHDNNRDWYAFTQVETQLTVTKAHNAWHPEIVHDIHQMGSTGPRIFFPPYLDPWEPNVDPLLTAAVNQLGTWMAAYGLERGEQGVLLHGVYDAFTPARAYQHYHGGARILSEAASARIATPITITEDELKGGRGQDATERAWNFPVVWPGGEWHLSDIVTYQENAVMALLTNAARNRTYWLKNFYEINQKAVDRWPRWPAAWVLPPDSGNVGLTAVLRILTMGDVEVHRVLTGFHAADRTVPAGSYVVPMNQPYASFAQALLARQHYPDLRLYPGGPPQPPYDVTAQTLPLLMGVDAFPVQQLPTVQLSAPIPVPTLTYPTPPALAGRRAPRIGVYKSWNEPIPEGWTRWLLDQHRIAYDTLHDADIQRGDLARRYDVLVFEDQPANQITHGWPARVMPAPYAGGLGESGVAAVRAFVQAGGRLVAVERATDFAIQTFGLGITSTVEGLKPQQFYIPGSILAADLVPNTPVTRTLPPHAAVWYWGSSRAFDVSNAAVTVQARYAATDSLLLSGWMLGGEHIAGKPAVVDATVGKGDVVLFGFPPNYRGQTIATWRLLFNALDYHRR